MATGEAAATSDGDSAVASFFHVLVVCRANVCRSPTAGLLLRRHLSSASIGDLVDVTTAGDSVVTGEHWCAEAAERVKGGPDRDDLLESHRSRPLTTELVAGSDLVLAAARVQRASVVRLSPQANTRTFTLKEAAALADAVRQGMVTPRGAVVGSPPPGLGAADTMRWLTREMHDLRGLVVPATGGGAARRLPGRRSAARDPLDIADPHGKERARHHIEEIDAAVRAWVEAAAAAMTSVGR